MTPVEPGQVLNPGETADTLELSNAQSKDPLVILQNENDYLKAELAKAKQEAYDFNGLELNLERANKTIEELTNKLSAVEQTSQALAERNTELIQEYNDMSVLFTSANLELNQLKGVDVTLRDDQTGEVVTDNTDNHNLDANGEPKTDES